MIIACALLTAAPAVSAPLLLPAPRSIEARYGSFSIGTDTPIVVPAGDNGGRNAGDRLAELLGSSGIHLNVQDQPAPASIRFVRKSGFAPEAYAVAAGPGGVLVTAGSDAGLFYGAVTVWQLATGDMLGTIPAVTIDDAPRFPWRGMMLDSARHFQSPAFIKRFIEWMALNKLNRFHWHLVDDQGWRLQIRKYPRLTEVSAWRRPAVAKGAPPLPPAGGFYTQADVRDIVSFAAARGVTVVPEIEMPGHALSAIRAYPELGLGVPIPPGTESDWGVFPWLYNVDDGTIRFLEDVLTEVMELFPSREIHVGGDEAVKDQWRASTAIQARIKALGLEDENALQGWLVGRMARFLDAHGRRLVGWDEILDGDMPPDAIVMSWRGTDGVQKAAAAGHDTVLAAAPTLYFDHRQGATAHEPPGRGSVVSLKDVAAVDPGALAANTHLLGLQGQVWTEHVRTEPRVAWMAFPRAIAVAEIGWSGKADYPDLLARLEPQLARIAPLGLKAADSAFRSAPPLNATERDSTGLQTCSGKVDLYLEDDWPAQGDRAQFLIDILDPCWRWTGAQLDGVRTIEFSVGQVPFDFQVGADRDKIRFRPPQTPAGEFEVRADSCDGAVIARLPLAPAAGNPGVTRLTASLEPQSGTHDLCFTYTAKGPDPLWTIDRVGLVR
jgi:hexosaminidase